MGGSGFIGARLVACLAERGVRARVVDLAAPQVGDVEWVRADVRDEPALRLALAGQETVFNLAAAHGLAAIPDTEYHALNVGGARAVCSAASACNVRRIIYTSSAAVYGRRSSAPDERTPPAPSGAYATTKLAAEAVYSEWLAADAARRLVIVRPTVVFGPGAGGVGALMLRNAVAPDFVQVGPARARKSLAFVDNLAAFLAFVLDLTDRVYLFNYADTPDLELGEVISIVRTTLGLSPARRRSVALTRFGAAVTSVSRAWGAPPNRRFHIGRFYDQVRFDATLAHRSGFRQAVPLRDALERTARVELGAIALVARHAGAAATTSGA